MEVKFLDLIFGQDGATREMSEAIFRKGWTEIGNEPPTAEMMTWLFQQIQLYAKYSANKWRASTDYEVGNVIYASSMTNSHLMMECTAAGTTGTIEPTWGVVGSTVTDGTVQWRVCDIRDTSVEISQGRRVVLGTDNKIDTDLMPTDVVKKSDFSYGGSGKNRWEKNGITGTITQWATKTTDGDGIARFIFPIPFPTTYEAVVATHIGGSPVEMVILNNYTSNSAASIQIVNSAGGVAAGWTVNLIVKGR